jgi:hypothetical protein
MTYERKTERKEYGRGRGGEGQVNIDISPVKQALIKDTSIKRRSWEVKLKPASRALNWLKL